MFTLHSMREHSSRGYKPPSRVYLFVHVRAYMSMRYCGSLRLVVARREIEHDNMNPRRNQRGVNGVMNQLPRTTLHQPVSISMYREDLTSLCVQYAVFTYILNIIFFENALFIQFSRSVKIKVRVNIILQKLKQKINNHHPSQKRRCSSQPVPAQHWCNTETTDATFIIHQCCRTGTALVVY